MILNSNPNLNMNNANKKNLKLKRSLFEDKFFLNMEDAKLLEFVNILINISVDIIVEFYMNKKFILTGGYLENMKEYKSEIQNKLLNIIFDKNSAKNSFYHLVFEEINNKFKKNKMVSISLIYNIKII